MLSADYKARARHALDKKWWEAVIIGLVAAILGDGMEYSLRSNHDYEAVGSDISSFFSFDPDVFFPWLLGAISVFALIYFFLAMTVGAAISVGKAHYYIKLVNGEPQNGFSTLFYHFRHWGNTLLLRLLTALKVFLWTLLLVIPGIVAAYRYSMATYIMAENPHISPGEALAQSARMMRGNKLRLFYLHISFIGWAILSALSFGIGYILLNPYMDTSEAAFYLDIKHGGGY